MGEPRARVAWRTTEELARAVDPGGFPDLELVQIQVQGQGQGDGATRAAVVVLDTRAFGDVGELLAERAGVASPVLVLASAEEVEALSGRLAGTDGLLLHDSPPALVGHHLRQLVRWSGLQLDGLTRLRVRRAFLAELERVLPAASAAHPASLLLVDIDYFKAINDEHGHAVGDAILQELAARIRSTCSLEAFPARFSGEKFVILLPADEHEAISQAEMLREAVRYRPFGSEEIRLTVSVGVATADRPVESRELLRQMDEALYAAKANGRDRAVHYTELEREAIRADEDIDLFAFENVTRVIAERVANVITRRGRRLFREIKQQADVDSLTGLYSRRYLDRRLAFELEESRRTGLPLQVALIDIDFFGEVNKRHGWPTGDRVLAGLALLLRQNVRATDWVARYGGEEFCLVMAGATGEAACCIAERVRHGVEQHTFQSDEGEAIRIAVSIGLVELDPADEDLGALMERASDKLLAAKRAGRNRVVS
jgi:diguanylate cyclase (GGDEF)-like protein